MMNDKKKIEKMQEELKENVFFRNNVLSDLLGWIDESTGNFLNEVYVPQKERDCDFLKAVIIELGYYEANYDEEYNPYHECYCYKITNLVRAS